MTPQDILNHLLEKGMTQKQIGDEVGLSQSSISEIARGLQKSISWEVGNKLFELHQQMHQETA